MKSLSVGFISQDWSTVDQLIYPNGCTWYRCMIPASVLNSSGHSAHVGGAARSANGTLSVHTMPPVYKEHGFYSGHKIIVLKLAMHLSVKNAVETALTNGQKIVVDIDDFFDGLPDTNRAKETTDPNKNSENNRDIYFQIIDMAHALICSTPFLYDFYNNKYPNKPIFMVRNSIDIGRWKPRKMKNRKPTIGWVGATPWRGLDLEQLSPFFSNYIQRYQLKFHHSGHIDSGPVAARLLGVDDKDATFTRMVSMFDVPKLYDNIDIGIVPLNDIPFNHAKSYLKGLEYAAAGVPFISSNVPEYKYLADAGVGRIASSHEEWMHHFDELQNFSIREDEALVNNEIVRSQFSMSAMAPQWINVFKSIMDL